MVTQFREHCIYSTVYLLVDLFLLQLIKKAVFVHDMYTEVYEVNKNNIYKPKIDILTRFKDRSPLLVQVAPGLSEMSNFTE